MRRCAMFALCLVTISIVSACAARKVDEELLPTRVPTVDTQALAIAAETAIPTRAPTATSTPEPASLSTVPTTNGPAEATSEPQSSSVIEYGGATTNSVAEGEQTDAGGETSTVATADSAGSEAGGAGDTAPEDSAVADAAPTGAATQNGTAADSSSEPSNSVDVVGTGEAVAATSDGSEEEPGSTANSAEAAEAPGSVDPRFAGMPENMIAAMAAASPDNGAMLTLSTGCTGCHSTDPNQFMAGPTWYNIAETAATRVEDQSAGLYLYTSIVDPNAHLVDGYLPNIMIQTYDQTLSDQNMADIISYLLTIRGR